MKLRIGTRRSRLALAQAREIAERLAAIGARAELVPMLTAGDRGVGSPGRPAGMKGLFVTEIVQALQRGEVDLAVHSAKDLPAEDPDGVRVGAVPHRADPFDVLVTRLGEALSEGSVVGTSSLRRQAQLVRSHPGLAVIELRGNVDTRLAKLAAGQVDGLVLAAAGLHRLGIEPPHLKPLPLDEMVPAPGQGALAVQIRIGDDPVAEILRRLDDGPSRLAFETERAVVARLGGGCALPLGVYARASGDGVWVVAVVARADGTDLMRAEATAPDPREAARAVSEVLVAQGAAEILASAALPTVGE